MEKSFRIKTNVSQDQVVRTNITQDIDFLEILSLKIKQEDTYKLHTSNYGIIVGRVLANEAFGIPNAKVSVFIPLDDTDNLDSDITNIYPYDDIQTKDKENRRYNLLPDSSNDKCYRIVGTFPNKRLLLDNDIEIEVYEKYWKYTTVTNKSGDYMIFGVPTGTHQIHVDVDLSDIGILSQKPRDFIYKGYNITQFDNANQFKESTNLDNLSQLLSQTNSVYVYPFWGDSSLGEIAITRCDLQVQYKFEPTCVFFGCIVSDNFSNNIGDKCNPSKFVGFNRNLVAGEGTIEMIRKTPDGLVEEFQIQGNRLIDVNGVWCYQIPMNLDYVGTDEFGNIVPTDNPNKGIATRTSVRFRFSMQETNSEGVSRHRAKYLVPNVQNIVKEQVGVYINNPNKYLQCYEFGSATLDEYFRDLYWNKVYSVKNYIPRIQLGTARNTQKYSAIRTVNDSGNLNPFPFNHARFRLYFGYRVLCILMDVIVSIICAINGFVSKIAGWKIPLIGRIFSWVCKIIPCISFSGGLSEDEDVDTEYFPCCTYSKCMTCAKSGCKKETKKSTLINVVQQSLAQEYDTVNLDFYNDWINGCLYFPLWFWKKTKKKKFFFGLFTKKAVNRFCNCDNNYKKLKVTENCALYTDENYDVRDTDKSNNFHYQYPKFPRNVGHGIIKEFENNAGLNIYYYAPGIPTTNDYKDTTEEIVPYVRLYSTDIILLGSLNDCDLDNLPRPFINLPSSTANIPYIATLRDDATDKEVDESGTEEETGTIEVTGMDWLGNVNQGLFMDLTCVLIRTKPKTCVNLARLSELGVTLDSRYFDSISVNGTLKYDNERPADGMITRYELIDNETRAMFASLNHNGLTDKIYNPNTGYYSYKLLYNYPTDFDGHLSKYSASYTSKFKVKTYDNKDLAYIDYKFGVTDDKTKRHFYSVQNGGKNNQLPLFNNSFYFYFGLNEGNTAIDKFNNLFYSECFQNSKYPFTLTYTYTPAKWCKENDNVYNKIEYSESLGSIPSLKTDYATITIHLNGIKTPYSYSLFNEVKMELLTENDIYTPILKFGYDISNGSYSDEQNGALKYLTDGSYFKYKENGKDYVYLLDNETYTITITDVNGKSITQTINIMQSPLSINYNIIGLGDKYYENNTEENDICNEYAYYGEINIESINLDGHDYSITNFESVNEDGKNGYKLTLKYNDNNAYVFLHIQPFFENNDNDLEFHDCICTQKPYEPQLDENILKFKIWIPGDYMITVTQYCHNILNDNTSSEIVNVPNGSPFLTYLQNTPIKFIIGKNTNINNDNFYSLNEVTDPNSINVKGWFNLQNENYYRFEDVNNESQISIWEDFVNTELLANEDGEISDITIDTKLNILQFKFKCLMEMSSNYYMDGIEDKTINYLTSGGKAPILSRGSYPEYVLFSTEYNPSNKLESIIYDSDANVTCLYNSSNIVGLNYTAYDENQDFMYRIDNQSPKFNPLFGDTTHIGNYFAAFTSNAGCELKDNEWVKNDKILYEANPFKANPFVLDVYPGESQTYTSYLDFLYKQKGYTPNDTRPYFRTLTVDRRIDYAYFIMMPYNNDDLLSLSEDSDIWRNGRIVGYQINGIEMAYDKNYNNIGIGKRNSNGTYTYGNDYEFYFPEIYSDPENMPSCFGSNGEKLNIFYNNNIKNKKLYSCTLKTNISYNIKDRFWGLGRQISTSSLDGLLFNNYSASANDVNGDFSQDNYPIIRRLDIYNIPYSNKLMFSAINCKYGNNLEVIDNSSVLYSFENIIDEGDETSFSLNGNNAITLINDTLEDCASNSVGNVTFIYNGNFKCNKVNVNFKMPTDNVNTTHRYCTYLPFFNYFKYSSNPFDLIKKVLVNTNSTMTSSLKELINNVMSILNGIQLVRKNVTSTSSDFNSIIVSSENITNDIFLGNDKTYYRFTTKADDYLVYDDNAIIKSLTYNVNKQFDESPDFLSIYYLRRYLNNEMDNLSKDLLTFNIGTIVDIRPFNMECECSIDTSLSGSGSTEIEVPSIDVDEDGNPITGTTTGSTTTDISVKRQVTKFKIYVNQDDVSLNQQFIQYEKMSAAIKYQKKVTSNASFTYNNNILEIEIIWGGALSGILLEDASQPIELYLKMPNNFIFQIKFNLNKNGEIS